MTSFLAAAALAAALAQQPADPAPSWLWTTVYGQRVQVWGVERDGRTVISRDWNDPAKVAPVEQARRQASAARRPAFQTNGVKVDELSSDGRTIRASDPATLDAESKRKPCGPDGCDPESPEKMPALGRGESDLGRAARLAFVGLGAAAAVLIVVSSRRPPYLESSSPSAS